MLEPAANAPPLFRTRTQTAGTTCIVSCIGELDLASAPEGRGALLAALDGRPGTLVVDLSGLTFLDSSGVRLLLEVHGTALAAGVALQMVPAPEPTHHVFRLCGLEGVLPFARTLGGIA